MVFASQSLLIAGVLLIIGREQMGEVGIVNVPTLEFLRGGSLERICRRLVDEGRQELSFAISQQHD
jgi:hypothetical protein